MASPSRSTIEEHLRHRTRAARENLRRVRASFDAIVAAIEQGAADNVGGAKRIRAAGSELSTARIELEEAISDFKAYFTRGILPEHLPSREPE
jgi:hypothetical protein